ncbi:hypothetical protein GQ53DRAFT_817496 [Thozetella sp. PMI_491]|nr:hypothetical protein GQ53DRAFT_817496 [Thozetella sp. PMI_491]
MTAVTTFILGIIADRTEQRLLMLVIVELPLILSNTLLSVWYIPKGALLFAFTSRGHQLNGVDHNLAPLLVATGKIFTYTFSTFIPLVLFPTYDAPHYK